MTQHVEDKQALFAEETATEVRLRIYRYSPDDNRPPRMQEYRIPVKRGMTILDGLHYVRDTIDATLAYRYSCRMGVCGSCGMFIQGLPRLACQTQILELESETIEIKPMPNYPVIKDLVTDLSALFEKHRTIMPFLVRGDDATSVPECELLQSPEDLEGYMQFAYCIKCGLCMAACPTVASDSHYLGPQSLPQAFRYNRDTRDEGWSSRVKMVSGPEGPWRCHFAGACSEACPKGVDPALGIQLLKRQLVLSALGMAKARTPAPLAPEQAGAERRPGIPEAPAPTVEDE